MTTVSLTSPSSIGTRPLVRAWCRLEEALPERLDGVRVEVDCSPLRSPSSSFVDELLNIVVVERNASTVAFLHTSERMAQLARQAASNRGITERVKIEVATRTLLERLRG
jgi:hypothetical protein